jgi:signal transduction histidine kinase
MKLSPRQLSIEWSLPLAICGLLLIVVITLAWRAYLEVSRSVTAAAEQRLESLTDDFSLNLGTEAARSLEAVRSRTTHPALIGWLKSPSPSLVPAAESALVSGMANPERVAAVELRDTRGRRMIGAGSDTVLVRDLVPDSVLARLGSDTSGGIGNFLESGDTIVLPVVAPVRVGGRTLGLLVEWRRVTLSAANRDQIRKMIGTGSGFFVGSAEGIWTDQAGVVPAPTPLVSRTSGPVIYQRDGASKLARISDVPGTEWKLVIELSRDLVLAPANQFLRRVLWMTAGLLLVGLFGVWWLTRRITAPLGELTLATERISDGDYSGRVVLHRGDELGRLATAFNTMARNVEETHGRLQANLHELQSTRAQFAHAQRMDAVGRLAGGIAHDFNNLLTVILGETELALAQLPPDGEVAAGLLEVQRAGERAAALTGQLLAFSRRQLVEASAISINELVRNLEKMLTRLLGEPITLVTQAEATNPVVRADRGQIEQVVMILVVNARDAMPNGGRIVVQTANVHLDDEYVRLRPDVQVGDYVMLAVSDTGVGMTDEVKSHLFEPFFTTKERSRGTGLGLAMCYGIIKQSGGHIAAYSEPGVGTTIRAYLPVANVAAEPRPVADGELPRGHETILLVEDDEAVRKTGARILEARGYHVIEAADSAGALKVLEEFQEPIHLLLTDVVLPGIGGRELSEKALLVRPEIRVLFASGYTDDVILQHQLLERDVTILQKPFTAATIHTKVREVLDTA